MDIRTHTITLETEGFNDVQDLTPQVAALIGGEGLVDGSVLLFVPGATGGLTTIEFESGAVSDLQQAIERLGSTGIADPAARVSNYPFEFSGGMKQRISIARSFAVDPDILLMDEPFVFLDYQNRLLLQELLLSLWQDSNKTIMFVTHNINEAVSLADRVMIMTAHPGKVKTNIKIDLPRPRDMFEIRKSTEYTEYVNHITDLLKDEMIATQQQAQVETSHEI